MKKKATLPSDTHLSLIEGVDYKLAQKFDDAEKDKISISDFIHDFLHQFISKQTQQAYTSDLTLFFQFLKKGGLSITHPKQIKGRHFQLYRDELMEREYSSATINRKLVAIRSFIKWAIAAQLMDHNPLNIVKLPKVETQTPTLAFDDNEVLEMLNSPELETPKGQTHRMVLQLLFSLGLRRSELANIKISDIYQERGHFVLSIKGKGSKYRHLPLSEYLQKEIHSYIEALKEFNLHLEPHDYLIQSHHKNEKNTKPINGSSIYRIIEKYAKKCHINKRVSPHSCRATVISHLLDTQKTAIRDVAIFAGHSKITTTERYDKRRESLDHSAAYDVNYTEKKKAN